MKISVIIPAYNSAAFIEKTLKSVFSQTFRDFELIVVNDGSKDATSEKVKKIFSKNPCNVLTKLLDQDKGGVSKARNKGIEYASGEYLLFLDSDDLLEPTCLEKLYKKAKETNSDIVYCGFNSVNENNELLSSFSDKYDFFQGKGNFILEKMLSYNTWICTGSAIYKKKLLDCHGLRYKLNCIYSEDQEFVMKSLVNSEKISSVEESLMIYVKRSYSTSRKISMEQFHRIGTMLRIEKYFKKINLNKEIIELIKKRITRAYMYTLMFLLRGGIPYRSYIAITKNPYARFWFKKVGINYGFRNYLKTFMLLHTPVLLYKISNSKKIKKLGKWKVKDALERSEHRTDNG